MSSLFITLSVWPASVDTLHFAGNPEGVRAASFSLPAVGYGSTVSSVLKAFAVPLGSVPCVCHPVVSQGPGQCATLWLSWQSLWCAVSGQICTCKPQAEPRSPCTAFWDVSLDPASSLWPPQYFWCPRPSLPSPPTRERSEFSLLGLP